MRKRFAALFAAATLIVGCATISGTSQAAGGQTIFGGVMSGINTDPDTTKSTVGTQFKVGVAGEVSDVRVYRTAQVSGSLTGKLAQGSTVLATVTLPAAGVGWQDVALSQPVSVVTGKTYTVYYTAPAGRYAVKSQYSWPKVSGDLTAVKGVYTFGNGVPTSVYNNENYWVDVVFNPTPAPPTTSASPSPTTSQPPVTTTTTTAPTTIVEPTTTAPTATTSTPPGTANCAPNPSACGYPDATNTGVPDGTALSDVPGQVTSGPGWHWDSRGWIQIDGNGAVFSGYRVSNNVDVTASNVTISNNAFTVSGDTWAISLRHAQNTTISRNTITSPVQTGSGRLQEGIRDIYGDSDGVVIVGNDISHADSAVNHFDTGGRIEDNYFHDFGYKDGDHVNGIQLGAGTGPLMTIRHNTIFNQISQTDCIMLATDDGPQTNRLIEDNLLAGGGYTVYGAGGPQDTPTNIRFINNRFARMFYPNSGAFGPVTYFVPSGSGNAWSGNVWDEDYSPVGY